MREIQIWGVMSVLTHPSIGASKQPRCKSLVCLEICNLGIVVDSFGGFRSTETCRAEISAVFATRLTSLGQLVECFSILRFHAKLRFRFGTTQTPEIAQS